MDENLKQKLADLKTKKESLTKKSIVYQEKINNLEGEINELKQKIEKRLGTSDIDELNDMKTELEQEIEALTKQIKNEENKND
jgi:chaperonin cofactor prefoldin